MKDTSNMILSEEDLHKLLIEEEETLDEISHYIEQPNYMEVLGVNTKELQHSNFLAWMLDSNGSHGMGDSFLKRFINTLRIEPELKILIALSDNKETKILREYQNIDLLIVNNELRYVICIENKINSERSGDDQLIRYHKIVEDIWGKKDYKRYYVYLTPRQRILTPEEEGIGYENITYSSISKSLKDSLRLNKPKENVEFLINDYIKNLNKNIIKMDNVNILAQKIYMKYKKELDFIMNNKPTLLDKGLYREINEYFKKNKNFENLTPDDKRYIRILPKDIVPLFEIDSESWEGTESVFAIELMFEDECIWVKYCLGARNSEDEEINDLRNSFFSPLRELKSLGSGKSKNVRVKTNYVAIATYPLLSLDDVSDLEELFSEFLKAFKIFDNDYIQPFRKEVMNSESLKELACVVNA